MDEKDPIKHVVLLMMENHSFDQMLGCLQGIYPELDGVDLDATDTRFNPKRGVRRFFRCQQTNSKYLSIQSTKTDSFLIK